MKVFPSLALCQKPPGEVPSPFPGVILQREDRLMGLVYLIDGYWANYHHHKVRHIWLLRAAWNLCTVIQVWEMFWRRCHSDPRPNLRGIKRPSNDRLNLSAGRQRYQYSEPQQAGFQHVCSHRGSWNAAEPIREVNSAAQSPAERAVAWSSW